MNHVPPGIRRNGAPIAISMVVAAALPAAAVAKSDVGVDVSLNASAASNPFQSLNGRTGSASAAIALSPWITFTESASSLRLTGDVRVTEYQRVFGRTEAFRLNADGRWAITPQLDLSASISFGESIVGETNVIDFSRPVTLTPDPSVPGLVTPGIIVIEDPSLNGLRSRQQSFNTSVTAQYRPDGRQRFGASFYARQSRFSNLTNGGDYAIYGETISYDRVFRRGTFGATLNLQRFECRSGTDCSQVIVSPQLTANIRLNSTWSLSGAAGLSYSALAFPGQQRKTVTPSVSATVCRQDARTSVCLGGTHTVEATALSGARPILSANVSARYRIDQKNTILLNGNYAGTTGAGLTRDTFRQFTARLTDEYRFNQRVAMVVSGSHSISNSTLLGQRSNTEVSIGVRLSFGNRT